MNTRGKAVLASPRYVVNTDHYSIADMAIAILDQDSFVARELPKTAMFKRAAEWASGTDANPLRDRLERK